MEFKKLSDVEMVETVSGAANVLIEEDGVIKRASKNKVNAQADWAETDSSSPAFIKNKPEYVLDIDITINYDPDADDMIFDYEINKIDSYANIKNRILNGELQECKSKIRYQQFRNADSPYATEVVNGFIMHSPEILGSPETSGGPEHILFGFSSFDFGVIVPLTPDDVILGVFPW